MENSFHNESESFRLIAAGDESAFRDVFELYKARLVGYLHTFTKSEDEAKELTQDVFLKLWMNRAKLSGIESPRNYLFAIAKNCALDFLRRAAADHRMREQLWRTLSEEKIRNQDSLAHERSRRVEEAMRKLSHQKQAVFRLSRVEGLSYEQIATHMSISKNTVKNHIVASLKFIRNYVSADQ